MAVLDKNAVNRKQEAKGSDAQDSNGKTVDLLQDKSLPTGEKRKVDATEDAWQYSAPPKAGRFTLKLHLAKDPVTLYADDPNKAPGYSIAMEAKIVSDDPTINNITVFPRVTTFYGRGKNISTAAGLIGKLGFKIPEEADDKLIATLLYKALQKEPVTDVELDWQGYSKVDKRVVYKNMEAFPKDDEGEPNHIVDYMTAKNGPGGGAPEEIRAQLQVVHWYGKNEKASAAGAGAGTGAGAGKANGSGKGPVALKPQLVEEEETTPAPVKGAGAAPAPAPVQQSIETDLEELLEE